MIMRLERVERDLVKSLEMASKEQRLSAVKIACELAVKSASVDVPIVIESLCQLRLGHKITAKQVSDLKALARALDEQYFDLQENPDEGPNIDLEVLRLFSQTRAVSALCLAGGEDSLMTTTEAIYEASSAVDDRVHFFKTVLSVLSGC